jgi:hypothetical protein
LRRHLRPRRHRLQRGLAERHDVERGSTALQLREQAVRTHAAELGPFEHQQHHCRALRLTRAERDERIVHAVQQVRARRRSRGQLPDALVERAHIAREIDEGRVAAPRAEQGNLPQPAQPLDERADPLPDEPEARAGVVHEQRNAQRSRRTFEPDHVAPGAVLLDRDLRHRQVRGWSSLLVDGADVDVPGDRAGG